MSTKTSGLPESSIPLFTTVASFREWRRRAFKEKKSVGFVATMGALHEGHLSLVRRSLAENDRTVLSIFVNPAQFAPHEDLGTYPRTLERDLQLLSAESLAVAQSPSPRTTSAVFLPTVHEMYPSGIVQNTAEHRGAFVEVKGYGHQMEGKSRPTFFLGVATVVTKLFNVIQPSNTYFGQKDIQQALLLRRMCRDLLLEHPSPDRLHIVPTARDPTDELALSSRNTYLSPAERRVAPVLRHALVAARDAWGDGDAKAAAVGKALAVVEALKAQNPDVEVRLDYIEMNDAESFDVLEAEATGSDADRTGPVILSGAVWVGKTRLIDNIVLGDTNEIIC
ncbi:hypothetical protein PLICRDRAFT_178229 [Plicaturopsis crispa FD-325 SS-3]|nr:hypothetical protein PLICRDRAFT_178229 [Plicaturopsis crispa FD-325 SS-3]